MSSSRTNYRREVIEALRKEPAPILLDTSHVAAQLGVSYGTAVKYMREGQLPIVTVGKRRKVPMIALQQWMLSALWQTAH